MPILESLKLSWQAIIEHTFAVQLHVAFSLSNLVSVSCIHCASSWCLSQADDWFSVFLCFQPSWLWSYGRSRSSGHDRIPDSILHICWHCISGVTIWYFRQNWRDYAFSHISWNYKLHDHRCTVACVFSVSKVFKKNLERLYCGSVIAWIQTPMYWDCTSVYDFCCLAFSAALGSLEDLPHIKYVQKSGTARLSISLPHCGNTEFSYSSHTHSTFYFDVCLH